MNDNKETIVINNESFLTKECSTAYHVVRGTVTVFIVPYKGTEAQRRKMLYEASEGETIPSLCYRDGDYVDWQFVLKGNEIAEISEIENGSTKVLKRKFANKIELPNFEEEGFERGLVELYKQRDIEEDGLMYKSDISKIRAEKSAAKLIVNAFESENYASTIVGKNELYDVAKVICKYMNITIASYEKIKSTTDTVSLQDIARLSHFSYREIVLENDWYKKDIGPVIVFDENEKPYACIPKGRNKLLLIDSSNNRQSVLNYAKAKNLKPKAFMLYKSLPNKAIEKRDLFSFAMGCMNKIDLAYVVSLTIIGTLIGLLIPILNQKLFDDYIPMENERIVISICVVIGAFMFGNVFFTIANNIASFRIGTKMGYVTQAAIYDRLFNLDTSSLNKYESADLAMRAMSAGGLVNAISTSALVTILSGSCSILYLIKMFKSSIKLTMVCILFVVIYALVLYLISIKTLKHQFEIRNLDGKTNSIMMQLLSGIEKIRIAGVESRGLLEYFSPFSKQKQLEIETKKTIIWAELIQIIAEDVFLMILFFIVVRQSIAISTGSFIALNSSLGLFMSGATKVVHGFIDINTQKPSFERLQPILESKPELGEDDSLPGRLKGQINIDNVTFSYGPGMPNVISNLSLTIKEGEYVGIVGVSGSGKSTLMKLLLGFEKPTSGKISFDGKEIESLDKRELRKQMGVVLQDGELITGSIYENIAITNPNADAKKVNEVIKAVGLEEDIRKMPMGVHTLLNEGAGTISGGQKQRILIARAVINNPSIVIFDEATSALDNITQSIVCQTVESMQSTRIIIAHRLSTIMGCDRIIVLGSGRILEEGTYKELMDARSYFYDLAKRQIDYTETEQSV